MVIRRRLSINGPAMVFVTTTVVNWTPVFASETLAQIVIEQLRHTAKLYDVSIVGYVVMPSHVHFLLGFPKLETLSDFMRKFKRDTARQVKEVLSKEMISTFRRAEGFVFWKARFDDIIIWTESQWKIKLDYIHNNPVKSGLVAHSSEYLFSSARDWLVGEAGLLPIDKGWKWER